MWVNFFYELFKIRQILVAFTARCHFVFTEMDPSSQDCVSSRLQCLYSDISSSILAAQLHEVRQ